MIKLIKENKNYQEIRLEELNKAQEWLINKDPNIKEFQIKELKKYKNYIIDYYEEAKQYEIKRIKKRLEGYKQLEKKGYDRKQETQEDLLEIKSLQNLNFPFKFKFTDKPSLILSWDESFVYGLVIRLTQLDFNYDLNRKLNFNQRFSNVNMSNFSNSNSVEIFAFNDSTILSNMEKEERIAKRIKPERKLINKPQRYEACIRPYDRTSEGNIPSYFKFTANNDKQALLYVFNGEEKDYLTGELDDYRTIDEIIEDENESLDPSDEFVFHIKNLTTGQYIYKNDYMSVEEWEEDDDDDDFTNDYDDDDE